MQGIKVGINCRKGIWQNIHNRAANQPIVHSKLEERRAVADVAKKLIKLFPRGWKHIPIFVTVGDIFMVYRIMFIKIYVLGMADCNICIAF